MHRQYGNPGIRGLGSPWFQGMPQMRIVMTHVAPSMKHRRHCREPGLPPPEPRLASSFDRLQHGEDLVAAMFELVGQLESHAELER